jgi:hypothetical protein
MFNHHKMKRRLKRRRNKKSRRFLYDEASTKDFAWKYRKKNPFRNDDVPFLKRIHVQLGIIAACIFLAGGTLVYHPFFRLRHIELTGLQRIEKQEFLSAVRGVMDFQVFFLFPKSNFFIFSEEEVGSILSERFPLESIAVTLQFPNRVSIHVQEKVSTLIYDNGQEYSYVGLDGKVIEILRKVGENEWRVEKKTVTSTDEFGDIVEHEEIISREHIPAFRSVTQEFGEYPLVYDVRQKDTPVQTTVMKEATAQAIFDWFQLVERRANIPVQYIVLESEIGDAVIKTGEGWVLKVKLNSSIEDQFEDLELFLLEKKVDRSQLNYIDLRYPGKIYWQ